MKRTLLSLVALFIAAPLFAQNANLAQLRLVIVDQTGAGIPAAMITLTPQGSAAADCRPRMNAVLPRSRIFRSAPPSCMWNSRASCRRTCH